MKNTSATLLLSLVLCTASFAQALNKQKLDSLFDRLFKKDQAMGSLALSKNGKVIYSRAIGYSFISPTEKIPATVNTKYRIGSITKMFTATMVFQAIEEGKLTLTTTLDKYFPSLPNAAKINMGHLLNHRSGLHNFTDDPDYMKSNTQARTHEEMISIIGKYPIDFQPDEKTSYSNSNFVVLGYILENIYKIPYEKLLKTKITAKAGLSNTYVGGKTDVKKNESFSYNFKDNTWAQSPETDMSVPGGAGAIVSTPTDLTKFIEALFSLKFVSQASLNQMKTITDGMGKGMMQFPFYEKRAYGHMGNIDAFASTLGYFQQDSVAVAYCTNGMHYSMNDILLGVLSVCFNKKYTIPSFNTITLSAADLDQYIGVYASAQVPLKITVTKSDGKLFAQATGQPSFPLDAEEKDKFKYDAAGVRMEFNPAKGEFVLKQGGGSYLFKKE